MNEERGLVPGWFDDGVIWAHSGTITAGEITIDGTVTASKIAVNTMPYAYEIDADRSPDAMITIKQSGKEVLRISVAQLAQLGAGLEALALDREFKE